MKSRSRQQPQGLFRELVLINTRFKPSARWTNDELVVIIYFSSRRIGAKSISQLLSRRGYQRSTAAIKHKIREVVRTFPSLRPSAESWNKGAVDRWLDSRLGRAEEVNRLIEFTTEDAEIVAQVGPLFSRGLGISSP
jgi:hypothetical protein